MLLMVAVPEMPVTEGTPLRLQLVAFVVDQVKIDAEPLLTVVGDAERVRVGGRTEAEVTVVLETTTVVAVPVLFDVTARPI